MRAFAWWTVTILLLAPAAWAAEADIMPPMAGDFSDPAAVVEAMRHKGATELPAEALTAYQAGLAAWASGDTDRAMELLTRATELDPGFPESHLALARIQLLSDPAGSVRSVLAAFRSWTASFGAQHLLLVNAVFLFLFAVAMAAFLVTTYASWRMFPRLAHSFSELGRRWFPPSVALVVAGLLFVVPFSWRVGVAPVLLLFGGLMWHCMSRGDRRWVGTLCAISVAAPGLLWLVSPVLYSPLDPTDRPMLLSRAMVSPYSPELTEAVRQGMERYPEDPHLVFALGTMESRGGNLKAAESAFRQSLELGGPESQVHNNLGVLAFRRGAYDTAIEELQRSIEANDRLAAPHFNLSQAYAKKLYFERADEEMAKANELSFNRVRSVLRLHSETATASLIDEPLPASALWSAAWKASHRAPELPSWMRFWFPGTLGLLPLFAGLFFAGGLLLGRQVKRVLPSFACTNCGKAVCRRCLRRIRKQAYCTPCGDALLRIHSAAYSKLVLDSRLRRSRSLISWIGESLSWTLPGFRAVQMGHVTIGATIALVAGAGALALFRHLIPVSRLAWIDGGAGPWWPEIPVLVLALAVAASALAGLKLKPVVEEDEEEDPNLLYSEAELPLPSDRHAA